ncbi:MAG: hypothetical protein KAT68_05540 [Bacteroidales bacterium]|nr:hypothetical protein [Bacteroidales bacterium]
MNHIYSKILLIIQIFLTLNSYSQIKSFGTINPVIISPTLIEKNIIDASFSILTESKGFDMNNFNFSRFGKNSSNQFIFTSNIQNINSSFGLIINYQKVDYSSIREYLSHAGLVYNYNKLINDNLALNIGSQLGYIKYNIHIDSLYIPEIDTTHYNINFKLASSINFKGFELGIVWSKNQKNNKFINYNSNFRYNRVYFKYNFDINKSFNIKPLVYYNFRESYNNLFFGFDLNYKEKLFLGLNLITTERITTYLGIKLFKGFELFLGREIYSEFVDYRKFTVMLKYKIN